MTPVIVEVDPAVPINIPAVELPEIKIILAKVIVNHIIYHCDAMLVCGVHQFA